jgi:hypothetical protein
MLAGGKSPTVGSIIELSDELSIPLLQKGSIVPADMEPFGTYISLREIILPGLTEKHSCAPLEKIELRADQAIELMLNKSVIPASDDQWRPYGMRLKKNMQTKRHHE